MQSKDTQISPTDRLKITYTDKPVSGWGGLVALIRFFDRIGIRELLAIALPDGRKSNNRVEVVDIVMTLFATVLTGGQRFAHASRIQADSVVQATLGVARMASATTLTRYFGGFVRSQVEHLSEVLGHFIMSRIPAPPLGAVLDLDSTVFTRYGKQQGSLKGYNPQKRGRPSHHPILAMLADSKVILHAWLRSGNSGTARGVKAFLAESLARLPKGFRLYALRADSGFYIDDFLCDLEQRQIPYAIAVRMTRPVQRSIFGIRDWVDFAPGLEAAELLYQAPSWNKPRRVVVVREEIAERPEARGRKLIDVPGYTFHAVVTCMALAPVELWRFYNSRADCENRLKELKDDFGAAGFCLDSFDGTEAVFRLICFLFNLLAEFKRSVLRNESPRLMSIRNSLLVVGAVLGTEGRRKVLRLGLCGKWRKRFANILERIGKITISNAAQFDNNLFLQNLYPPKAWRSKRVDPIKQVFAVL